MKTLFDRDCLNEITDRINKLTPETQRLWGTMSVNQMLAHCSVGMQTSTGEKYLKSSPLLRMIGSMLNLRPLMINLFGKTAQLILDL